MDQDQRSIWAHLLMTVISVAGMAVIVWMELPESQRAMMTLTMRTRLQRMLHRSAQRAGHAGMGAELHERYPAAGTAYGAAYWLARLRDRM